MKIFKKDKTYFFVFQVNTQVTQGIMNAVLQCQNDMSVEEVLNDYLEKNKERLTIKMKDPQDPFKTVELPVQNIAIIFFSEVQP